MDTDLKDVDDYGIGLQQSAISEKEIETTCQKKTLQCYPHENPNNSKTARSLSTLSKVLTILTNLGTRLDYLQLANAKTAAKMEEREFNLKRKEEDKAERNSRKELKNLRKEYLFLLAIVKVRINKLLKRQEKKNKKKEIGSFKLKVKWMETGVYNKDNLTLLFSKYGCVINVVVLENKNVALVEYKFKTSAINAKQLEDGYPNCPLTVSFLGDYGEDTIINSNYTSASSPNTSFSAYQNPNDK